MSGGSFVGADTWQSPELPPRLPWKQQGLGKGCSLGPEPLSQVGWARLQSPGEALPGADQNHQRNCNTGANIQSTNHGLVPLLTASVES